ncbi:hypothetical protein THRCLA_21407 [Thraustotheca clavata]|uniref:Crinkler (CRN) family protein n=1 Tax=Thraustotheca clavata TaxID=74557 RepID=A0A1V9ZXH6_9STRA|nr:hypothetical protein THRCLA_21407 [Thraustotheca clavata]
MNTNNPSCAELTDFGIFCPGDHCFLFRRQSVLDLLQCFRDKVLGDRYIHCILGPPGSGKSIAAAAISMAIQDWVVTWIHWVLKIRENRRLVLVILQTGRGKLSIDHDLDLNLEKIGSWVLTDYLEAIEDDEFYRSVQKHLGASGQTEPIDKMDFII